MFSAPLARSWRQTSVSALFPNVSSPNSFFNRVLDMWKLVMVSLKLYITSQDTYFFWRWHAIITTKWKYQSWVHCAKSCPESLECQNRTTSRGTAELLSSKNLVSWQLPARKQIYLTWRNFYFYCLIQLSDAHICLLFLYWKTNIALSSH